MTTPRQRESNEGAPRSSREKKLEYLRLNWEKLRRANKKAADASRLWEERNADFNYWVERQGLTDILQIAKIKKENLLLNDAFDTWHFWQREAVRISSLIQAEKDIQELIERVGRDVQRQDDLFPAQPW